MDIFLAHIIVVDKFPVPINVFVERLEFVRVRFGGATRMGIGRRVVGGP